MGFVLLFLLIQLNNYLSLSSTLNKFYLQVIIMLDDMLCHQLRYEMM